MADKPQVPQTCTKDTADIFVKLIEEVKNILNRTKLLKEALWKQLVEGIYLHLGLLRFC